MTYKEYLLWYKKFEHPASTLYHKHISKNIAKVLVYIFLKLGISPNSISGLSFLLSIFAATGLVLSENIYFFLALTQLSYALDCSDGVVARITKTTSKFGQFLDLLLDRLNQLIIFVSVYVFLRNNTHFESIKLNVVILGFIVYYMYSQIAMIRGFIYKSNRGNGVRNQLWVVSFLYEFIDTGIYLFLLALSLMLGLWYIFSIFYFFLSIILIAGLLYHAYSEGS